MKTAKIHWKMKIAKIHWKMKTVKIHWKINLIIKIKIYHLKETSNLLNKNVLIMKKVDHNKNSL